MIRKRRHNAGFVAFWVISLLAWFAPGQAAAISTDALENATFSSSSSGWSNATGGQSCSGGRPSLGLWEQNTLSFSYTPSTVTQQVIISQPSVVTFSATVADRSEEFIHGRYEIVLSDSNQSVTTGSLEPPYPGAQTSLSVTTTAPDEMVTISISGDDNGLFWAGCYGPSIQGASLSVVSEPTSIVVTSLLDDGSTGTLRWAISQANATSGGIYDSITLPAGTITLNSALPIITQNLTVDGNGQASTIIDGAGQFRVFNVNPGVSLTASDMTLQRGQNTNGGLIYNNRGTVTVDRVRFTNMSGGSAVFNSNGVSVAYYTDSTWDGLFVGIAGDYGSTPNLAAGVTSWGATNDTVFQNRTYVTRGTFTGNIYGINNYRFTKVVDSSFTNNSAFAANVTGLNRTQILNSSFTNNGTAIYHSSWIPVGWNMGVDNRLISGNTFTGNVTSIHLSDSWNNGQKNQSWSTVTNNTWSGSGTWIAYDQWNGSSNIAYTATPSTEGTVFVQSGNVIPAPPTTTTTTTTTTVPPTTTTTLPPNCGPYEQVSVTGKTNGSVWGSGPYTDDSNLGVAAVHAGLIEAGETAIIEMFDVAYYQSFAGSSENGITTLNWNSGWCGFNIRVVIPPTTTTTEPTTTVPTPVETDPPASTEPPSTEAPATEPPDTIPNVPTTIDGGADAGTGDIPDETSPETTVPEPAPEETTPEPNPDPPLDDTPETPTEAAQAVEEAILEADSPEELQSAITELLDGDIEPEVFAAAVDSILEADLSEEEFVAAIDAIIESDLSEEEFDSFIGLIDSADLTDEQIQDVVSAVLETEISADEATTLATSADIIASVNGEQAAQIFAEVPAAELSEEEALAVIAAVQDAPMEVKEAFEEEIDIFGSGTLDTYVPIGSSVPVGTRRVLIAATAVIVAAAPAPSSNRGRAR